MGAAVLLTGGKKMPAFAAEGTVGASPGYPSGIVAGMPLVCHYVARDATTPAITIPAGWTEIGLGTNLGAGPVGLVKAFWKIADGSESGSLAVTATGSVSKEGVIRRFTNGTSIEAGAYAGTAASATNLDCVNVTTTNVNELAVQLFCWVGTGATVGNVSGETGTDYTEAIAEIVGGTHTFSCQTGQVPSATAITGGSATLSSGAANRTRHGFAILP